MKIWGTRSLAPDRPLPHQAFSGHPGGVNGVAFAGDLLVSVGQWDALYVWRLQPEAAAAEEGGEGDAGAGDDSCAATVQARAQTADMLSIAMLTCWPFPAVLLSF